MRHSTLALRVFAIMTLLAVAVGTTGCLVSGHLSLVPWAVVPLRWLFLAGLFAFAIYVYLKQQAATATFTYGTGIFPPDVG